MNKHEASLSQAVRLAADSEIGFFESSHTPVGFVLIFLWLLWSGKCPRCPTE